MRAASLQAAAKPRFSSSTRTKAFGATDADALGDVLGRPVRDDEQAQFLVVLRRQRGRCGFESRPGAGSDDDGNNGRSTRVHQFIQG